MNEIENAKHEWDMDKKVIRFLGILQIVSSDSLEYCKLFHQIPWGNCNRFHGKERCFSSHCAPEKNVSSDSMVRRFIRLAILHGNDNFNHGLGYIVRIGFNRVKNTFTGFGKSSSSAQSIYRQFCREDLGHIPNLDHYLLVDMMCEPFSFPKAFEHIVLGGY
ncbi:hypothetical protein TNCV_471741 [Trichonephila clavipes]|uniref:Uncharacterized protein n=1 Tax=Trichonephila clavipes TaxID=2585209 RepID=A0A8X6RDH5_TRICX|nr:hypothetical protein TNCV_471741 [Trichonephila clavipes]